MQGMMIPKNPKQSQIATGWGAPRSLIFFQG